MSEPPDHHRYEILVHNDTMTFYIHAIRFYESLLKRDIEALNNDPDLKAILNPEDERFAIHDEADNARGIREWLEREAGSAAPVHFLRLVHRAVRFIKSVCLLYLKHIEERRNALASKSLVSRHVLATVDRKISALREKVNSGVFKDASTIEVLAEQPVSLPPCDARQAAEPIAARCRPVVLDSIEILDSEVRARCLDLFAQFQSDGQHERLDTVITESTRILEDRIRSLSGAPPNIVGADLAGFAFGTDTPRIVLSDVAAEQQAAHLLFRGIFGIIRNKVHHRLVADLTPERALQIVAMVDYLLSLIEARAVAQPASAQN